MINLPNFYRLFDKDMVKLTHILGINSGPSSFFNHALFLSLRLFKRLQCSVEVSKHKCEKYTRYRPLQKVEPETVPFYFNNMHLRQNKLKLDRLLAERRKTYSNCK